MIAQEISDHNNFLFESLEKKEEIYTQSIFNRQYGDETKVSSPKPRVTSTVSE